MDFDLIEQLSEKEVEELYDDIALKDNLTCGCTVRGDVMVEETGEITSGLKHWFFHYTYCDAPENRSHAACSRWCHEHHGDVPVDDITNMSGAVYVDSPPSVVRGHLHSWYGVIFGFTYHDNCIVPPDAECTGDGWSRYCSRGQCVTHGGRFLIHCVRNE